MISGSVGHVNEVEKPLESDFRKQLSGLSANFFHTYSLVLDVVYYKI